MKITLIKSWNGLPAGSITDPSDGVAELLIKRGFAERADEQRARVENKSLSRPRAVRKVETA